MVQMVSGAPHFNFLARDKLKDVFNKILLWYQIPRARLATTHTTSRFKSLELTYVEPLSHLSPLTIKQRTPLVTGRQREMDSALWTINIKNNALSSFFDVCHSSIREIYLLMQLTKIFPNKFLYKAFLHWKLKTLRTYTYNLISLKEQGDRCKSYVLKLWRKRRKIK